MTAPTLTTYAAAKAWLGLGDDGEQATIERLIVVAGEMIASHLGNAVLSADHTERIDGGGGRRLVLGRHPVSAIASLAVDGRAVPLDALRVVNLGQPAVTAAVVERLDGVFARGFANVEVSYTAGYATTPPVIEQACLETVQALYLARDRDPLARSESVPGVYSATLAGEDGDGDGGGLPPAAEARLRSWRRVIAP